MSKEQWKRYFTMKAKAEETAEVLIYESIGESFFSEGIGAKQFAKELKALGSVKQLDIRINSPGGSVFEGQAIYSQLKSHKAAKTVYIDGLAASIASVIAMAGDTIVMPRNATMMIHDPWTMAVGTAEDMRKTAEALDTVKSGILAAYRDKSGLDDGTISELMSEETWMDADEAAEWGFVDQVEEPVQIAAHFDLARFRNVPETLKAQATKASLSGVSSGLLIPSAYLAPDLEGVSYSKPQEPTIKHKEVKTMKCKIHPSTDMEADECPKCKEEAKLQNALKETREKEVERIAALTNLGKEFQQVKLAEFAVQEGWQEDQLREKIMARILESSAGGPLNVSVTPAHEGKPFRSFGEQLTAVMKAGMGKGRLDDRLHQVYDAATGASEAAPSDGGFLVQSDFSLELLQASHEVSQLYNDCNKIPIGPNSNGLKAPIVDQTSRATGSRWGGVQVYRTNEADTATSKKPKFAMLELSLEKLMGIFYATDELLQDSTALEAIGRQAFAEEMGFKIDDEIINGTGSGEMLGFSNSNAIVTQAKEAAQTADTVVAANIFKMYSRMPARLVPGAKWYINTEVWPQLFSLNVAVGSGGSVVFLPPGGMSVAPYGTLMGRPIVPIEHAAALGDVGDINFCNLMQYALIEKGGLDAQSSIHVRFLYDESVFKFVMRNNGEPMWKSALTPYKGAATQSPFINLAARA